MKKIALICLLIGGTLLSGSDYKEFVGLGYGQTKGTFKTSSLTAESGNEDTYSLRAGFVNDISRIYLNLDYLNADDSSGLDEKWYTLELNLEGKTSPYKLTKYLSTSFFVGGHVGLVKVDLDTSAPYPIYSDNKTDAIYGLQTGLLMELPSNFELEIGYKYSWSSLTFESIDLDRVKRYYIAVNYRF